MKKPDDFVIACWLYAALIVMILGGVICAASMNLVNRTTALDNAVSRLHERGLEVAVGEVHSPSIIEVTDNYADFLNFTITHNIWKVYEIKATSGFLALLDQSYGLEYRPKYDVKGWWIW